MQEPRSLPIPSRTSDVCVPGEKVTALEKGGGLTWLPAASIAPGTEIPLVMGWTWMQQMIIVVSHSRKDSNLRAPVKEAGEETEVTECVSN